LRRARGRLDLLGIDAVHVARLAIPLICVGACKLENPVFDAEDFTDEAGESENSDSASDLANSENDDSAFDASIGTVESADESSTSDTSGATPTAAESFDSSAESSIEQTELSSLDSTSTEFTSTFASSDSWSDTAPGSSELPIGPGGDVEMDLPSISDQVPLPMPLCPANADLLSCLDFSQDSLDVAADGSPYGNDAFADAVFRRWSHPNAAADFLRYGWESDAQTTINVAADSDLQFATEVKIEAWWHPIATTTYSSTPLISLSKMISIDLRDNGYGCVITIGGAQYTKFLTLPHGSGVQYVACSLKAGMLKLEAVNDHYSSFEINAGLADLSPYAPNLRVLYNPDGGLSLADQSAVIYAVRVWGVAEPPS
jgi:hypothetical protein